MGAMLKDHVVYWPEGRDLPIISQVEGGELQGRLATDLTIEEIAALDNVQSYMGLVRREVEVLVAAGERIRAHTYLPQNFDTANGLPHWDYDEWSRRHGPEYAMAAPDFFATFPRQPAIAARVPQLLVRAGSKLRAGAGAPTALRHAAGRVDVVEAERREPYARFFAVEEIDVSYRRFDGSMSPEVTRAGFVSCDAVTVLPYDPVRDRVLVVEQFRTGPHLRGDPQPWQIEAIAGRIDSGETPEGAARREAKEEAGLSLGELIPVAQYYPSPGILTEYLYSYLALTDLPDDAAGVFGLEGEAEDIRGHLLSFEQMMAHVASGEISNAPMLLTAYWLAANRARLRGV